MDSLGYLMSGLLKWKPRLCDKRDIQQTGDSWWKEVGQLRKDVLDTLFQTKFGVSVVKLYMFKWTLVTIISRNEKCAGETFSSDAERR